MSSTDSRDDGPGDKGMGQEERARRAQELVYEAWDCPLGPRRLTLGRRALELDGDCADALLLLAEACLDLLDRADLCRQAVDAGERSLAKTFPENLPGTRSQRGRPGPGDYWLLLETRPYMRARFRLAAVLADLGLTREAASHYRALCELNPADNQGARHRLAELLLELDASRDLDELLERYSDERSPVFFHYTRALQAYRRGERQRANELLDSAVALNPHVPAFLWGDRPLPEQPAEHFSLGDEDEAAAYAHGNQPAWFATAGALRWLQEIAEGQRLDTLALDAQGRGTSTIDARIRAALGASGAPDMDELGPCLAPASRDGALRESLDDALETFDESFSDDVLLLGRPPLEGKAAEVAELLEEHFGNSHEGANDTNGDGERRERALDLWAAYATEAEPTIRKAAIFAAAHEYVVWRLDGDGRGATQAELAKRYGVSKSALARAANTINDWIERELGDEQLQLSAAEVPEEVFEILDAQPGADRAVLPLDDETLAELAALPRSDQQWSGALRPVPFQVMEPRLHRPTLAVWYDEGNASILGQELYGPTVPPYALAHTLLQSFYAPLEGEPRLPASVRVEEPRLAAELADALEPLGVSVEAGPLRAIGELMRSLESFLSTSNDASYLDGEVTQAQISNFFSSTAALRRAASWTFVSEGQVLGLDLDRWDLGRVCVSVVGDRGYERGLLIFRELDDYLQYFRHAAMSELDGALVGAPVEMLSLLFEHGAELEPSLRREVFKYGWEVVGPEDYPLLLRSDGDGGSLELSAEDYRVATVCAEAVALFCERHHRLFCGEERGPVRERIPLEHVEGLESVYVVAPHPVG